MREKIYIWLTHPPSHLDPGDSNILPQGDDFLFWNSAAKTWTFQQSIRISLLGEGWNVSPFVFFITASENTQSNLQNTAALKLDLKGQVLVFLVEWWPQQGSSFFLSNPFVIQSIYIVCSCSRMCPVDQSLRGICQCAKSDLKLTKLAAPSGLTCTCLTDLLIQGVTSGSPWPSDVLLYLRPCFKTIRATELWYHLGHQPCG